LPREWRGEGERGKRREGEAEMRLNIEQGLTNSEVKSEYLLHKSHISVPCSEIDLKLANENNINKEKGLQ
jgi:hypothetical protein